MSWTALSLILAAAFLLLAFPSPSHSQVMPCTFQSSNGFYNLTDMIVAIEATTTKADLYTGVDQYQATYYANVCNSVTSDTYCPATTPVCQINVNTPTVGTACGLLNSQSFHEVNSTTVPDGGVVIEYTDGEQCDTSKGNHSNRTSIMHIACGTTSSKAMDSVVEDGCWYEIHMTSKYACPQDVVPPLPLLELLVEGATSALILDRGSDGLQLTYQESSPTGTGSMWTANGYLQDVAFISDSGAFLAIETVPEPGVVLTTVGLCNAGETCEGDGFTYRVISSSVIQLSNKPMFCLKDIVSILALDDGKLADVKGDCVLVSLDQLDASSAFSVTIGNRGSHHVASQFTYFDESEMLTYQVASSKAEMYAFAQCYTADNMTTCALVDPLSLAPVVATRSLWDLAAELMGF